MGKFKKRKKKPRNPPLSFLDKCIYIAIGTIGVVGTFVLFICLSNVPINLAARDVQVIAAQGTAATVFFVLPFLLYAIISALIIPIVGYTMRKPIFGNKAVTYGAYPWARNCYPLFGPQRRKTPERPSTVAFRRWMFALWCAGFLLTACLVPFGLFGRNCLREDHSIVTYNLVNVQRDKVYTAHDYDTLTIRAVGPTRYARYYSYLISIRMEDSKKYIFDVGEFFLHDDDTEESVLRELLAIKARFSPGKIQVEKTEYLPKVVEDQHLTAAETALLYELFGVTPPA